MRATRGRWLGWAVLGLWVALLLAVGYGSLDEHGRVERQDPSTAADRFTVAWQRGLEASFFAKGTFERTSDVTGASISSDDVVAQDPPRRLHRQLGGIEGRVDDRLLVCPSTPDDGTAACVLGAPGGPTYAEDVARQVASLEALVRGDDPVYDVRDDGASCFALTQRRSSHVAPFGARSRYCFDPEVGALVEVAIDYDGGVQEHVKVEELRPVRPTDLEP